ncbi:ORF75 (chloroplast) [Klebsormidium nitens]|uniref:ORF75 n=1 Tax=Klebsormidium nitens TaxID=105231 RepID=A0A0U9HKZ8_KLENI|nr:ORF75 [Klebsormidium nitens]|eukprot:GAQ93772.1 ORF75 (chloroplast) [Klebsormidium nitens]
MKKNMKKDKEYYIWLYNITEFWELRKIENDWTLKSTAKQAHKDYMMSLLAGKDATANCFATLLVICTIDRINTLE